jgi:hypothetical protein
MDVEYIIQGTTHYTTFNSYCTTLPPLCNSLAFKFHSATFASEIHLGADLIPVCAKFESSLLEGLRGCGIVDGTQRFVPEAAVHAVPHPIILQFSYYLVDLRV